MYLPEDLHRFLAREAAERGTSMAEIAREAIGEYRARVRASGREGIEALIGIVHDEDPAVDIAERVDEALAEHYASDAAWGEELARDTD